MEMLVSATVSLPFTNFPVSEMKLGKVMSFFQFDICLLFVVSKQFDTSESLSSVHFTLFTKTLESQK